MALIVLAFGLAYIVRYRLQWIREVEPAYRVPFSVYVPSVMALTALVALIYWLDGAYRQERGRSYVDELSIVLRGTLNGIAAMIVIVFLATPSYYSRLIFAYAGLLTLLLVGLSRMVERVVRRARRRRGLGVTRVLVVGAGEVARSIMRAVVARPELGYRIVGYVDDNPDKAQAEIGRFPGLGAIDDLPRVMQEQNVDEVLITLPWVSHRRIMQVLAQCERGNIQARIVPDLFQMTLSKVVVENLDGIPLISVREPALRDWQVLLKRAVDVILASLALVLLAPVWGAIALAIRLDSPGPVIFRQERVGRGSRRFVCLKFRTMCVDAEARVAELQAHNEASGPLFKMRDDPRITRVGRWLRRASLDEVPQIINVLRGEMSWVGPRPGLPSEVAQYDPWHLRRLEVSPGITGLWQVSGRSDVTFDEMVLLDIYYIENWSLALDLRILLKTLPSVLFSAGAY
jgi:exopolysaccharide biosynthesis polyprenyl glycosylphosphotransferase